MVELNMYSDEHTDSSASILKGFRPGSIQSQYVQVVSPEEPLIQQKINDASIYKIDLEGYEMEVLGLESVFRINPCIIIVEVHPANTSDDNNSRFLRQKAIVELVERIGYVLLKINKSSDFGIESILTVKDFSNNDRWQDSDYLIVHPELRRKVVS